MNNDLIKNSLNLKNDFLEWKLRQLSKTATLFVFMLSVMHGVFVVSELKNLLNREVSPDFSIFVVVLLLRLIPIITLGVNFLLFKRKLISVYTFTYINNFVLLFVVIATGISKYFVPKPNNPMGSILIDSIIAIMATIFMPSVVSIFNFLICLITILLMGKFIPGTYYLVKDTVTSLVPFGIGMIIFVFSMDQNFRKMYQYIGKIKNMSLEDSLTGLYNRNILKGKVYDKYTERCTYDGSMLLLDIDHFKNVNDTYGHQAGDALLCRLSAVLTDNVRKDDFIVRFGGEEFLIVLRELPLQDAVSIAERIRIQVENCDWTPKFTVSCGVCSFANGNRFESVIKTVDDKLYEAKNSGRNRTCF